MSCCFWELIFTALWFNALLVLLALSSGAAFFTRIWRRKLTIVSAGMILFHLSFLALLGGVVYDGLFYFKGTMRLTEGETLPNGRLESYDELQHGRFFDFRRLRGETTLRAMRRGYRVDGQDKRAAYEVVVEDGERRPPGSAGRLLRVRGDHSDSSNQSSMSCRTSLVTSTFPKSVQMTLR